MAADPTDLDAEVDELAAGRVRDAGERLARLEPARREALAAAVRADPVRLAAVMTALGAGGAAQLPRIAQDLSDLSASVSAVLEPGSTVSLGHLEALVQIAELASDRRATVLHLLESALVAIQLGRSHDADRFLARASVAAGDDLGLRAQADFVGGQVAWARGERRRAGKQWAAILRTHLATPVPAAACRAAWTIARNAREQGNEQGEGAALRLALQAGIAGEERVLVEQIGLALARHHREAGIDDSGARVAAMLPTGLYPRLRAALAGPGTDLSDD